MSIETAADLEGLREVGRITRETLDALEQHVKAGVTTADLDAVAAGVFARNAARSAPALVYGFPGTVLISINDEIVHGVPGPRRLEPGDLVKLDVTVEKNGYIADAARSVLVEPASEGSDKPSTPSIARGDKPLSVPERGLSVAERLVASVRAAFDAALAVAHAGARVNEIGRAIEREVRRSGFVVLHGLEGHGVGRTIHEEPSVPNHYNAWQKDVLTEGLVLTIEPMISAGSPHPVQDANGWTIRTKDGSLSAHHEHTLVITREQPMILTA
jgi:methionyl aminopeptidase